MVTDRNPFSSSGSSGAPPTLLGLAGLAAVAGVAYAVSRTLGGNSGPMLSDAPASTARRNAATQWRESAVTGRSVTINRPRQELYDFWRDFANLPQFMENVRTVASLGDRRSHWVVEAPGGTTVEFDSRVTEDEPGALIAWESEEGADVRNSGRIEFLDAPPGRGTIVRATIAYDPPAGAVGKLIAKAFQREPAIQARRDLKRFKQLMETGEIPTTEPGPAAPRSA